MSKLVKATVSFKDPDFSNKLEDQGLSPAAVKKINSKSEFSEYYVFELQFDAASGQVLGARQVSVK